MFSLLAEFTSDPDAGTRAVACEQLGKFGQGADGILTTRAKTDADQQVRLAAVEALGRGSLSTDAIATLAEIALQDPDAEVRRAAIEGVKGAEDLPEVKRVFATLSFPLEDSEGE